MPVTKEEGGRLNTFAKEPKIEVINDGSSHTSVSRLLLILGFVVLAGLITISVTFS